MTIGPPAADGGEDENHANIGFGDPTLDGTVKLEALLAPYGAVYWSAEILATDTAEQKAEKIRNAALTISDSLN